MNTPQLAAERITSDTTPHTAWRLDCDGDQWEVTWLPGRVLDREDAITALTFAETVANITRDAVLRTEHPIWPVLQAWAGELGLTADTALAHLGGMTQ